MDEYQIIADARTKHNLDIKLYPNCGIVELVRYARHIGFSEGFNAAQESSTNAAQHLTAKGMQAQKDAPATV
jgi:hypothetical protein